MSTSSMLSENVIILDTSIDGDLYNNDTNIHIVIHTFGYTGSLY